MKKPKSLETKLRSAIRLIWSRSAERRAIIKAALYKDTQTGNMMFICPVCHSEWHAAMAEVDHCPALGKFDDWHDVESFINRMFFGPQRVIDKLCHKKITAEQRKKAKQ